jgi:plasmid stabilization system protein ParE
VRVIWSPAALREVARASDYLTDFNPRAAVALLEGLIAAGDSLVQFPYGGRTVRSAGVRELVRLTPRQSGIGLHGALWASCASVTPRVVRVNPAGLADAGVACLDGAKDRAGAGLYPFERHASASAPAR